MKEIILELEKEDVIYCEDCEELYAAESPQFKCIECGGNLKWVSFPYFYPKSWKREDEIEIKPPPKYETWDWEFILR